jgi:hypothetical protein
MRRSEGRGSAHTGVRGAALVAIALFSMLLVPALAAGIEATVPTAPAPINTEAPKLTGTPAVGQTLTCSTGVWANNPTSFSYTWLRNGVAIAGQNGSTYVVQSADKGTSISCRVTAGNEGGDYTISSLPSGSYKVGFYLYEDAGTNYLDQFYNNKSLFAEANAVSVTAPTATGGINAELHAGGQISGKVTNSITHAPLSEIEVCADSTGEAEEDFFGNCAQTNANGEYTLSGLPTASYEVEFFSYVEGSGGYVDQVYNDKSLYKEATQVPVSTPNTTAGINAELLPASDGGKISGVVTGIGKPLTQNVEVCAYQIEGVGYACMLTGAGGAYTLMGLPSGEYDVEFYAGYEGANYVTQYYNGESSYRDATPVSVLEGGTTTLMNAELHTGGQIMGRITSASGGSPLADISVCADETGSSEDFGSCATTNSNGEYTVSTLPTGSYVVEVSVNEGDNYVDQSYNGGASVSATEEGAPTTGINVALQTGGVITGKATDASTHAGIAGIEVCAEEAEFGRCASTNASGEYAIVGLSGTYSVGFYADNENLNYLSQTDENVSVSAGGTTSGVNAELHPGGQITGRVTDASTHDGLTKIEVCASEVSGDVENCAETTTGVASVSATSNALAIPAPNSAFTLAKAPYFEPKTDDLVFFFKVANAGKFSWSLSFKNSDVGFASAVESGVGSVELALAEASRKKAKPKKCKAGSIKHDGKCVHATVPFGGGSRSVPAGTDEIKVHASSQAIKGLKSGHTLHVSGPFTFVSTLGGSPVAHIESAAVKLPKSKKKSGKKHGKK